MDVLTKLKGKFFPKKEIASLANVGDDVAKPTQPHAYYPEHYPLIKRDYFTGEKTPGELGAATDYLLDYTRLRIFSWQSYLESEITQTIINKYNTWITGNGLRLQCEPNDYVLKQENITVPEGFQKNAEERFKVWARTRFADHARMLSLNQMSSEVFRHAKIGGDCLLVLRYVKGKVTFQLIDGEHVMTPYLNSDEEKAAIARGNQILHGVEVSPTGEHVAYYVHGADGKFYRVQRLGKKTGRLMAFMVYGSRYRIDEVRGMPLISAVLESLRKLDRYKEATVGSAEERQKIAYAIQHKKDSVGANPLLGKVEQARKLGMGEAPESKSEPDPEASSTKIAASTGKQVFNMGVDSYLELLESKNELYFKEFYDTNFDAVCSAMQIPPEIARSMYNSNYSASRAAIKDWEKSMKTNRQHFSDQFYQPYYNLWLEMEILSGKIQADGYMQAMQEKNIMALESYRGARWIGDNVPHIDPLKEVVAVRKKLGDDTTPLVTYEQATEELAGGEFTQNIQKVIEEKKLIPKEEKKTENQNTEK